MEVIVNTVFDASNDTLLAKLGDIFKPENETIYSTNDHFVTFKIGGVQFSRNKKTLPLRKATGSASCINREKAKSEQHFVQ